MAPGPAKQFDEGEVLTRAAEAFRVHGYRGTSIATLVDAMGIGRQSIYQTFGDKRGLFLRVIHHYAARAMVNVRAVLEAPGSPLGNLRRLLGLWELQHRQRGGHGCLLGVSCADFDLDDPEIAASLRHHLAQTEAALRRAIAAAQEVGEIRRDVDARVLARTINGTSQGMALFGRIARDGSMARDITTGLLHLIDAGATSKTHSQRRKSR